MKHINKHINHFFYFGQIVYINFKKDHKLNHDNTHGSEAVVLNTSKWPHGGYQYELYLPDLDQSVILHSTWISKKKPFPIMNLN